jgi:hypothetical protein
LECGMSAGGSEEVEEEEEVKELEEGDRIFATRLYSEREERIASTHSQKLAEEAQREKRKRSMEEMVPVHYLEEFREVFEKEEFDKLPERC